MSVSGVGGNSNDLNSLWAELRARSASAAQKTAAAPELGTALSAGTTAVSGIQTVTAASGAMPMNAQDANAFQQSMGSVGQALQSGDLGAAQSAFAQAKSTLASAGVHGHHHHHRGGGVKQTEGGAATASASPFAQEFGALGQALQNGDLAGAADAFSQMGTLLASSPNKLTNVPIGANSPANPMGGSIDLTA